MIFLLQCFTWWLPNMWYSYTCSSSVTVMVFVSFIRDLGQAVLEHTEALLRSYLGCLFPRHCSHWVLLLIYQKQNEALDGLHVIFMDPWMLMAKSHCKGYSNLLNYALHGLHSVKKITRVCYLDSMKWSNMELNYSLTSLELGSSKKSQWAQHYKMSAHTPTFKTFTVEFTL